MALSWVIVFLVCSMSYVYVNGLVVTVAHPVIFTNNNGGGGDEVQAPLNGFATKQFYVGGQVRNAWYTPQDNIRDLSTIRYIDVQPRGNQVELVVGGYSNNGRVRIKIYADIV